MLLDRFVDSSLAYQGGGPRARRRRGSARSTRSATGGLVPDLTLLLRIDPERGLARLAGEGDRLERRAWRSSRGAAPTTRSRPRSRSGSWSSTLRSRRRRCWPRRCARRAGGPANGLRGRAAVDSGRRARPSRGVGMLAPSQATGATASRPAGRSPGQPCPLAVAVRMRLCHAQASAIIVSRDRSGAQPEPRARLRVRGDQPRRVARAPALLAHRDSRARSRAARPRSPRAPSSRRPLPRLKISWRPGASAVSSASRCASREVVDVDVVAHRGPVGRRVVGAEDRDVRAPPGAACRTSGIRCVSGSWSSPSAPLAPATLK